MTETGARIRAVTDPGVLRRVALGCESRLRLTNLLWPALPAFREDDVTDPQVMARARTLEASMSGESYEPTPSYPIAMPKAEGGTRFATLLTLEDRIVYATLVAQLAPSLETRLQPRTKLFGPRMMSSRQRWWSFERSVLKESPRNVVIADVRDFGNSIDHRTIIASLGDVHAELASAIESFLGVTMGRGSGIPQGVDASARLSSIVLDEIGREMAKGGWKCFQCSDDFRIGVMDRDEGEAALEHLSGNLADAGLTLNASKSLVMSVDDYRTKLESEPRGWLWEKLNHPRAEGLIHGPVGIAARSVIGLVRSLGRPSHADGELEARTIWDAARRLQDLAVAGDGSALPDLPRLIEAQPVLTPVISGYLRKLATTECVSVTDRIIREPDLLDSQIAWLLRALLPLAPNLPEPMVDALRALASERGWIVRLEGMRILGARNESLAPSSERIPQQLADELELATAGVETRTFSRLGVDSTW